MDLFTPHFTKSEFIMINRFHIHLQLFFLSDVTDIQGQKLLQCIRSIESHRTSTWEWPSQNAPSKHKSLWKRACDRISEHLQTHQLGVWTQKNQCWSWKCGVSSKFLMGPDGKHYSLVQGRYGNPNEHTAIQTDVRFDIDADISFRSNK